MKDEDKTKAQLIEELEALRESEEQYRRLFENANDAIATFTLDGTITSVNQAMERVVGWSRREMIGQHYFVTPASFAQVKEHTRRALAGEKLPSTFELELIRKNGSVVPVEARAHFIRDQKGNPIGFQGIFRDISARKALEQQRANFLAMLIHDIKNPLGTILMGIDIVLKEVRERNSKQEEDVLERLKRNALTIHSLVTNYLDLSKIEAGHLILATKPLEINTILLQVGRQYETEAQRRGITLDFRLQEKLPLVEADPLALERIFTNLLHNALKFTPKRGQVTIHSSQQNGKVVAAVADTGPGIAPEGIPYLFEKYRQANAAKHQEGVGLGLFIIKVLVEEHGGRVEVESTLGQGTCFSVFLPIASADPAGA